MHTYVIVPLCNPNCFALKCTLTVFDLVDILSIQHQNMLGNCLQSCELFQPIFMYWRSPCCVIMHRTPSIIFVLRLTRSASSKLHGIPQDLPGWLPDTKKQQVLDMLLPAPWLKQDPDFQPRVKLPVGWEPPECAASSLRPPAEPLDARLWEGLQQVPDLEVGWLPAPSTFIAAVFGFVHDTQVQTPFVANGCIA